LRCSPSVLGNSGKGFRLNALRQTTTFGKKATRLCPCGYLGHPNGKCRCTPDQVARYRGKLSGPLLDRIDLQIEVPALPEKELVGLPDGESSKVVQSRVEAARARQLARQGKRNADLTAAEVDHYCLADDAGKTLLMQAINHLQLSARAYHRILRIARSIADLAGLDAILAAHVAEAIQYRRLTRE
jgi:magnesium chelatase family protein